MLVILFNSWTSVHLLWQSPFSWWEVGPSSLLCVLRYGDFHPLLFIFLLYMVNCHKLLILFHILPTPIKKKAFYILLFPNICLKYDIGPLLSSASGKTYLDICCCCFHLGKYYAIALPNWTYPIHLSKLYWNYNVFATLMWNVCIKFVL